MKVELFEIEDIKYETKEQSAEAMELIESMGLEGQAQPKETTTRFPYRLMNDEELFVYGTLCPEKADVHKFSNEPIPLQVLKTLAFAKTLPQLKYFEVWSAVSRMVKDPVLVARDSQYGSKNYMLARWGDELLPLEVLMPDAVKKFWYARTNSLNKIKSEINAALAVPCPVGMPEKTSLPYFAL